MINQYSNIWFGHFFQIIHPHDFWKLWNSPCFTWAISKLLKMHLGILLQIPLTKMSLIVKFPSSKISSGERCNPLPHVTLFIMILLLYMKIEHQAFVLKCFAKTNLITKGQILKLKRNRKSFNGTQNPDFKQTSNVYCFYNHLTKELKISFNPKRCWPSR